MTPSITSADEFPVAQLDDAVRACDMAKSAVERTGIPLRRVTCERGVLTVDAHGEDLTDLAPLASALVAGALGLNAGVLPGDLEEDEQYLWPDGFSVYLDISHTLVTNLHPIAGLPITRLRLRSTAVSDLSPLTKIPLKRLDIVRTMVSDLSPLRGLHFESIVLTPSLIQEGWNALRFNESLSTINGWPVEIFWPRFDSGGFGEYLGGDIKTVLGENWMQRWEQSISREESKGNEGVTYRKKG